MKILDGEEEIVRALHLPYWDADSQRASKSAFTPNSISVSRLSVLTLEEIKAIWKAEIEKPGRVIQGVATLLVSDVHAIKSETLELSVIEKITDTNAAHAEICGHEVGDVTKPHKITDGTAKKLLAICRFSAL